MTYHPTTDSPIGDRPATEPTDEIEVTPQMIEAGANEVLYRFGSVSEFNWNAEETAIAVHRAMAGVVFPSVFDLHCEVTQKDRSIAAPLKSGD